MNEFQVIQDIVVILLISLPIIFLFKRLHLPSLVGFLIAGMIIGPYGFKLIVGTEEIEVLAEIGVMLLLFTIGLEISFSQLMKMKKYLFIAGGLQLFLTIFISSVILTLLGIETSQAIFFGMLISLSSTAIVLKILSDQNELEAPQGKFSIGILIMQDLAIVPMFLLLPLLGAMGAQNFGDVVVKLLIAFASVGVLLVLSKYIMPILIDQIAKLKVKEVFTVGTILIVIGTAYLTHSIGLSFALGAFIAGLILSESDYNHQILSEIQPMKDAFNSIFFVSIGLLLNLSLVASNPLMIGLIALGVLILKALIIIGIVLLMKYPLRIAIIAGLGLAQVGEFAFVLASAGNDYNLFTSEYYNAFLASSIFTMIITPFLFKLSHFVGAMYESSTIEVVKNQKPETSLSNHVIVAGFGLNGRNLTRVLKQTGIKYVIIEMNPDTVREEKAKGENILYGDISSVELLHAAGVEKANVIVFAISDPRITRWGLTLAKKLNPKIFSIVRTRYVSEIEELKNLNADVVIPEEFETALQIFRKVLEKYHIPLNVIMQQVTLLRSESYEFLRKDNADPQAFTHLDEILAQGLTETYFINDVNSHIGKMLSEINLRAVTDTTIIAIVREGKTITNPPGKEKLQAHDTIVITGTHFAVDKAIELLNSN